MLKVMIVDDDFIVRQGMCDAIHWREYGCLVVAQASDGEEALELIPQTMPDIIFCDVVMPRMNGTALLGRVQTQWPWIKVVMVSAHDEAAYIRQALQSDAIDYLLKPFHEQYIAKVIDKIRKRLENECITLSTQNLANPQALLDVSGHTGRVHRAMRSHDRDLAGLEVRAMFYTLRANGMESRLLMTTLCVDLVMGAARIIQEQDPEADLEGLPAMLNRFSRHINLDEMERAAVALIEVMMDKLQRDRSLAARLTARVKRFIEERYAESLTIPSMAAQLNVSPNHLQTLFKREEGHTIRQHIILVRMEKAKELLRNTHEKVYAIGSMVGYQDTDFFTRTFVKYTGMTPQQYRETLPLAELADTLVGYLRLSLNHGQEMIDVAGEIGMLECTATLAQALWAG